MVDVEKELGPLFDKLNEKEKVRGAEYEANRLRLQIEYDEFVELTNTVIVPVMQEYQKYLQKKAIITNIEREPKPGPKLIGPFSITFVVQDINKTLRTGGFPNVKFTLSEGRILVETEIDKQFSPSDKYDKNQINQELVASKLTQLVKFCFED